MIAGLSFIGRTSPICPWSSRTTSGVPRLYIQPAHDSVLSSSTEPTELGEHHAANVRPRGGRRPDRPLLRRHREHLARDPRDVHPRHRALRRRAVEGGGDLPTPAAAPATPTCARSRSSRIFSLAESNRATHASSPPHASVSSMCASMISSYVASSVTPSTRYGLSGAERGDRRVPPRPRRRERRQQRRAERRRAERRRIEHDAGGEGEEELRHLRVLVPSSSREPTSSAWRLRENQQRRRKMRHPLCRRP